MAETSHSLNPNAAPFVAGGCPRQPPSKMTSSPPLLIPHEKYSQTSPKLLLPPPPQPISSSNVAPVLYFSTGAAAFCHDHQFFLCYGDHFSYHLRQTLYYATVGAGNCHGGFHPISHHALPPSPPATEADSFSCQVVPTASYTVKNCSSLELERRTVVKKGKILKKKKYVPHRRGGGSKDTWPWRRSLALTKVSTSLTEEKKNNGGDGATSLMIRNIPNHFQRIRMLGYLDGHCAAENSTAGAGGVLSEYDFFYLPIDFMTGANLGYAFVNFTTAVAASRFRRDFDGYAWLVRDSGKICQITSAAIQGKEALVANFNNSRFKCHRDHYLPVVFDPPRGGRFPKSFGKVVGQRVAPLRWAGKSVRRNSEELN